MNPIENLAISIRGKYNLLIDKSFAPMINLFPNRTLLRFDL